MGFMSNQWLGKGQGLRNRSYRPVSVKTRAKKPTDSWSTRNDVLAEITATRHNDEYQTLHLTSADAESMADVIFHACGDEVRRKLAVQVIKEMDTDDLLKLLATDFRRRTKTEKKEK